MLVSFLSPLAPAVLLLLSAFVLHIVMPRLPDRWQQHQSLRYVSAPVLLGIVGLSLLVIRTSSGADASETDLQLLSGWNFSTTGSVAALTVRADSLSLPFLIVTILVLLAATLLRFDPLSPASQQRHRREVFDWLIIGTGAFLVFVAANGLTLVYAIMAFDALMAVFWLRRGQYFLSVARLFLGIFTAAGLMVATLAPALGFVDGFLLMGLVLWLRLGLYPFFEANAHESLPEDEQLVLKGVALSIGIYLVMRVVSQPLPELVRWLGSATLLLAGLLSWLTGLIGTAKKDPSVFKTQSLLISWLIVAESLLILLAGPIPTGVVAAFGVGVTLSLAALWVTPALGRPHLNERAWSWPYLPAATATLTLIGVPLSLGWLPKVFVYQDLLSTGHLVMAAIIVIGDALALSGLVGYWLILTQGNAHNRRWSAIGIVMMVPFLTPGLGPFILSTITGIDLSLTGAQPSTGTILAVIVVTVGAGGLGFFRTKIAERLNIPPHLLGKAARLNWLSHLLQRGCRSLSKSILRVEVVLGGQHYVSWAILVALIGFLIILLN